PRYEQKRFDSKDGKQLVLSPNAQDGSLKVYQDMQLWRWALPADQIQTHNIADKRVVWIQVVKGTVEVNGQQATTSDGLAIWQENSLTIKADEDSEILLFDLPAAE
ncbi:pirin family protein, partial [Providencia sp. NPDC089923]